MSADCGHVFVLNRQRKFRLDTQQLEAAVTRVLEHLGQGGQEVNVMLISDRPMARLNREYRGQRGPTDVLSFAMRDGEWGDVSGTLLGDLVISLETVARQAAQPHDGGRPATGTPRRELALMTIHGLLHLLGHDHLEPAEEARMIARERELFQAFADAFPEVNPA